MPTIIALRTINAAYKTPFSGFNTMILRFILILQACLLLIHYSNKIAVFTAFSYVPPIILAKDSLYSKIIYQKSPTHFSYNN